MLNVATCAAIAEAVVLNKPLTHRITTVTGQAVARPGNYYVPIGMTISDLLEHCGGLTEQAAKVVIGGPMMGFAIADLNTPLTKTAGAITVLTREDVARAQSQKLQTRVSAAVAALGLPGRIEPHQNRSWSNIIGWILPSGIICPRASSAAAVMSVRPISR